MAASQRRIQLLVHCVSVRIQNYSVLIRENADQNKCEFGQISRGCTSTVSYISAGGFSLAEKRNLITQLFVYLDLINLWLHLVNGVDVNIKESAMNWTLLKVL